MNWHERYLLDLRTISVDLRLGSVALDCALDRILTHLGEWESCPFCCKEAVSQLFPPEERGFILWQGQDPLRIMNDLPGCGREPDSGFRKITRLMLGKMTFHRRNRSTRAYTHALEVGSMAPDAKPTLYEQFRLRFTN